MIGRGGLPLPKGAPERQRRVERDAGSNAPRVRWDQGPVQDLSTRADDDSPRSAHRLSKMATTAHGAISSRTISASTSLVI